jgi:NADH:ubiquinone oxidoreductase subunit D
MCINYGLTGVMSRSAGIKRDLRLDKLETYANYYYLNFRSYIGQNGDSYDRFLIRMNEMSESINIINQVINKITKNKKKSKKFNTNPHQILKYLNLKHWNKNNNKNEYISMEKLIQHFKY